MWLFFHFVPCEDIYLLLKPVLRLYYLAVHQNLISLQNLCFSCWIIIFLCIDPLKSNFLLMYKKQIHHRVKWMGKTLNFENGNLKFIKFPQMSFHDLHKYQFKSLKLKVYIHRAF